jgi:hypothetical protein
MERSIKKGGGLGVGMEDVVRGDFFLVRFVGYVVVGGWLVRKAVVFNACLIVGWGLAVIYNGIRW